MVRVYVKGSSPVVSGPQEVSFQELKKRLWLGWEAALLIERAGKEEDFMSLLEAWKDEEALTGGKGYWDLADVDSWLCFGFEQVFEALGMEEEGYEKD